MWCSVNYSGNLDPVMEWSRSDGTIVYSTVIYTNDTFPQTVTSTSIQMMNYSDNDVLYICKTYFKIATVDSQREGSSSATNAPDYQAECNLTVNVLCKALPLRYWNMCSCIRQFVGRVLRIGRVDAFRPKGRGFDSRSSRQVGTFGKSLTHNNCLWRFGVKFPQSIRAVSGAPLSSNKLE